MSFVIDHSYCLPCLVPNTGPKQRASRAGPDEHTRLGARIWPRSASIMSISRFCMRLGLVAEPGPKVRVHEHQLRLHQAWCQNLAPKCEHHEHQPCLHQAWWQNLALKCEHHEHEWPLHKAWCQAWCQNLAGNSEHHEHQRRLHEVWSRIWAQRASIMSISRNCTRLAG